MLKPGKNFVERYFDDTIDRITNTRIDRYIKDYATDASNKVDVPLAEHIRLELKRRAALGKTLDIREPLAWAGVSTLLSTAAAAGLTFSKDKAITRPVLWGLLGTTALSSVIQLARIPLRFHMAFEGGLDVALAMDQLAREKSGAPAISKQPAGTLWTEKCTRDRQATPACER